VGGTKGRPYANARARLRTPDRAGRWCGDPRRARGASRGSEDLRHRQPARRRSHQLRTPAGKAMASPVILVLSDTAIARSVAWRSIPTGRTMPSAGMGGPNGRVIVKGRFPGEASVARLHGDEGARSRRSAMTTAYRTGRHIVCHLSRSGSCPAGIGAIAAPRSGRMRAPRDFFG
jgi:hypothetical protein